MTFPMTETQKVLQECGYQMSETWVKTNHIPSIKRSPVAQYFVIERVCAACNKSLPNFTGVTVGNYYCSVKCRNMSKK